MNKILLSMSILMTAIMSLLSPLLISHGDNGCCAECAIKKEDDIEVVETDEETK